MAPPLPPDHDITDLDTTDVAACKITVDPAIASASIYLVFTVDRAVAPDGIRTLLFTGTSPEPMPWLKANPAEDSLYDDSGHADAVFRAPEPGALPPDGTQWVVSVTTNNATIDRHWMGRISDDATIFPGTIDRVLIYNGTAHNVATMQQVETWLGTEYPAAELPPQQPPPTGPTLELSWEPEHARVRILVTDIPYPWVTVLRRSVPTFPDWTVVRSAYKADTTTGALLVYDYEMPICGEHSTEYTLITPDLGRTWGEALAQAPTWADFIATWPTWADALELPDLPTESIDVKAEQPWLRHLGKPLLSRPLIVQAIDSIERPGRVGVYEITGRRDPVTVHDIRSSRRGSVTLLTKTREEAAGIRTITADGAPLLLQLSCCNADFEDCYMALMPVTETRTFPNNAKSTVKSFTFDYVEVARPSGEVAPLPSRTWADVLAETPTWAQVRNDTPTWLDVLLGDDRAQAAAGGDTLDAAVF